VSSLNAATTIPVSQAAQLAAPPQAEPEPTGWAKKVKAPSMVIDEDVNGFRAVKPGEGKRRKKVSNSV
jgi:splicing factor 45